MFFESTVRPANVILIPGSSQPQLMEAAADLYHQGYAPHLLPSGGATPFVRTTEWEFLKDIGTSRGVPSEVILREDQATNTFENARFSLDVLQQNHISTSHVILVCKNYHARRALLTYQFIFPRETEFSVRPVVDQSGITKDNWHLDEMRIEKVMNELEKVGKYFRKAIYRLGQERI
ncbi:YdcF family protein [Paenibacillus sp. JCM 10914]|uniref:YdcF family protein n=1 Tax=Paenibacillus sp. JCM 10914 TaxID=1236974 RepID=UPI00055D0096|nr:YdcF family protein [Paenibacillus sp. JCM 10914]